MSNKVFLHNSDTVKKIVVGYLIGLIPLVLYGIYKNGILLYERDLLSFVLIPKVIYLLLISLVIYFIINKFIFKQKEFLTMDLFFIMVIPLFMPPGINLIIYALGLFFSFLLAAFLEKKVKFNKMAFCKLFIILLVIIFSNYTYQNAAEALDIYSFNYWDLLWGRNCGGIASTNIIFGLIFVIFFCIIDNYKKIIAISSLTTFSVASLLISNFNPNVFLTSSAILGLIFLNSDSLSTPHSKKGMIIYGVLGGLLTTILTNYLNSNEGVFISILFLSFFSPILDKIAERW